MKGFTLIELLVVVLIIGILAAVAVPKYQQAVYKSRMTEGVLAMRNLVTAEEAYYMSNGTYTGDLAALDVTYPDTEKFTVTYASLSGNRYAGLIIQFPFTTASLEYTLHSVTPGNIGKYYCLASLSDQFAISMCSSLGKFSHKNSTTTYYLISGGKAAS